MLGYELSILNSADVDPAGADETVRRVEQGGGAVTSVELDVTDPGQRRDRDRHGGFGVGDRFDGLVNNAGTDRGAGLLDLKRKQSATVIP